MNMDAQMLFSIQINHWISVKCGFKVEKKNSVQDILILTAARFSAHTTSFHLGVF